MKKKKKVKEGPQPVAQITAASAEEALGRQKEVISEALMDFVSQNKFREGDTAASWLGEIYIHTHPRAAAERHTMSVRRLWSKYTGWAQEGFNRKAVELQIVP